MSKPSLEMLRGRAMTRYCVARIQRSRARGWQKPDGAVVVTRGTKWGNPYRIGTDGVLDNAAAVAMFREYLGQHPELVEAARVELRGKVLCCWCSLDKPCHADVLLEVANAGPKLHG